MCVCVRVYEGPSEVAMATEPLIPPLINAKLSSVSVFVSSISFFYMAKERKKKCPVVEDFFVPPVYSIGRDFQFLEVSPYAVNQQSSCSLLIKEV